MSQRPLWTGPIVDAHQHFWDPVVNNHPWLKPDSNIPFRYGDYSAIKRRYLPDDYLADAVGHQVRETVYVETEWDPETPDRRDPLRDESVGTFRSSECHRRASPARSRRCGGGSCGAGGVSARAQCSSQAGRTRDSRCRGARTHADVRSKMA
jgi:hypothetical protein